MWTDIFQSKNLFSVNAPFDKLQALNLRIPPLYFSIHIKTYRKFAIKSGIPPQNLEFMEAENPFKFAACCWVLYIVWYCMKDIASQVELKSWVNAAVSAHVYQHAQVAPHPSEVILTPVAVALAWLTCSLVGSTRLGRHLDINFNLSIIGGFHGNANSLWGLENKSHH